MSPSCASNCRNCLEARVWILSTSFTQHSSASTRSQQRSCCWHLRRVACSCQAGLEKSAQAPAWDCCAGVMMMPQQTAKACLVPTARARSGAETAEHPCTHQEPAAAALTCRLLPMNFENGSQFPAGSSSFSGRKHGKRARPRLRRATGTALAVMPGRSPVRLSRLARGGRRCT